MRLQIGDGDPQQAFRLREHHPAIAPPGTPCRSPRRLPSCRVAIAFCTAIPLITADAKLRALPDLDTVW
ncbi:MAG: hypothetical protein ACKOPT_10735 [Cyanobium sp.]